MKTFFVIVALMVATAHSALATDRVTLRGTITDSMCPLQHDKADAEACAKQCVAAGAKYVFVSRDHIYSILNPQHPDVLMHAGHAVILVGTIQGNGIRVVSVDMP